MEAKQDFPTFCYNVKNIQMIPSAQGGNTVNLAQIDDNKTIQYIAQPFTTSYGQSYTLVNPVQLGGQNGQIVINKPISSVSFRSVIPTFSSTHEIFLLEHDIKYKLQMWCLQSNLLTLNALKPA